MKALKVGVLSVILLVSGMNTALSSGRAKSLPIKDACPAMDHQISSKAALASTSKVQTELDKAKKAGKAVFVVISGNGSSDVDKANTIAKGANAIYKNAIVLQMNRDDDANAELVKEWRLAGAPLPIIMVVSPKGVLSGGIVLAQATAENVAGLIPSPKLEAIYDAIGKGKTAIVLFTKKSFTDKAESLKSCKEAISMLGNDAVLVEVDMDDKREAALMKQLKINSATVFASLTIVINKQGQVAGTSNTIPDPKKLVAAAKTPVKSGCGPGCGPAGCGK